MKQHIVSIDAATERQLAVDLFNEVWRLIDRTDRIAADDDRMVHMAHASRHHWGHVGEPVHVIRGEWMCSRVYAVLGRSEPCLHQAQRALDLCVENDVADWDLAFAYEALARGYALGGAMEASNDHRDKARAVPIAEDEDRDLLLSDLATI